MNSKLKKTALVIGFTTLAAVSGRLAYQECRYRTNLELAAAYTLSLRPSGFEMVKPQGPDSGRIIRYSTRKGAEIYVSKRGVEGHGRLSDATAFLKIGEDIVKHYCELKKETDKGIRCTVETTIDSRNGGRAKLHFKGL